MFHVMKLHHRITAIVVLAAVPLLALATCRRRSFPVLRWTD
jgi:hypothetical protein